MPVGAGEALVFPAVAARTHALHRVATVVRGHQGDFPEGFLSSN